MPSFDELGPGTKLRDEHDDYWIKLTDDHDKHFTGMLANIYSGEVVHYSAFTILTPVYGFEIPW